MIQPHVPVRLPCLSLREPILSNQFTSGLIIDKPRLNIGIFRVKPLISSRNFFAAPRSGDLTPLAEDQLELLVAILDGLPLDWFDGRCVQGSGTYSANDFTSLRRSNVSSLVKDRFEIYIVKYGFQNMPQSSALYIIATQRFDDIRLLGIPASCG